jgi:hypothetical protein
MLKRAQASAAEHRELVDLQALHGPQKGQQLMDAQKSLQANVKGAIGDLEKSMGHASAATRHSNRHGFDASTGDADAAPYPLSAAMKDLSPLDAERIAALIEQATANTEETAATVSTARETITQRKQRVLNLRRKLREQIQALQMKTATAAGGIDRARDERNALVRQYVLWRRRREFDEDAVAPTFEQELEVGPRTRDVETQCVVQSETLPMQILKLVRIMDEEDTLKDSLKIIKSIVRDMDEINRFMRVEITCPVCRQLFRNCVVMWPCGHSFCAGCFEGLQQAPGMFRCAVCSMTSADGCSACCTVDEVVGRWLFKKSGFSEVVSSADEVQAQLAVFSKGEVQKMLRALSAVSQHL